MTFGVLRGRKAGLHGVCPPEAVTHDYQSHAHVATVVLEYRSIPVQCSYESRILVLAFLADRNETDCSPELDSESSPCMNYCLIVRTPIMR